METNEKMESGIFKLSTGERIDSAEIENLVEKTCHYVKYVLVDKDDKKNNVAFIFPNKELYTNPDYLLTPMEGCFCPRDFEELGRCLTGCLRKVNLNIEDEGEKIKDFVMISSNSEEEKGENYITVIERYKALLTQTHGSKIPENEEIYYIKNI